MSYCVLVQIKWRFVDVKKFEVNEYVVKVLLYIRNNFYKLELY